MSDGSEEIGRGEHMRQEREETDIIVSLLRAEQFHMYYLIQLLKQQISLCSSRIRKQDSEVGRHCLLMPSGCASRRFASVDTPASLLLCLSP